MVVRVNEVVIEPVVPSVRDQEIVGQVIFSKVPNEIPIDVFAALSKNFGRNLFSIAVGIIELYTFF